MELIAFNKLDGMVITSYAIYTNNTKGNVGGDVMIPNPTVTTIEMVTRSNPLLGNPLTETNRATWD